MTARILLISMAALLLAAVAFAALELWVEIPTEQIRAVGERF